MNEWMDEWNEERQGGEGRCGEWRGEDLSIHLIHKWQTYPPQLPSPLPSPPSHIFGVCWSEALFCFCFFQVVSLLFGGLLGILGGMDQRLVKKWEKKLVFALFAEGSCEVNEWVNEWKGRGKEDIFLFTVSPQ